MSHAKGTDLGGIRSIEDLRLRCRMDPDTGCWNWGLSTCEGHPRVWVVAADGTRWKSTGAAASFFLREGRKPVRGKIAYRSCCNNLCVNPEHVVEGTRADHGALCASRGVWKNKPNRIAANRRNIRGALAKLTIDQAREIRSSLCTDAALAKVYGIARSQINAIRRGKAWREHAPNSSVFNLAA